MKGTGSLIAVIFAVAAVALVTGREAGLLVAAGMALAGVHLAISAGGEGD